MKEIRVLLVDDEEELVATLQERLEMRGMKADAATNGEQALAMIREGSYDAAVVDLKMPGINGHRIVQAIRDHNPEIRIVLITGHGSRGDEVEEPIPGDYPILLKPFHIESLVRQIQESVSSPEMKP